jgi:hypothetical protein
VRARACVYIKSLSLSLCTYIRMYTYISRYVYIYIYTYIRIYAERLSDAVNEAPPSSTPSQILHPGLV